MNNFDENSKGGCFKVIALLSGSLALILNNFTSCGRQIINYTDDIAGYAIKNGDELITTSDDITGYVIKNGDELISTSDDVAGYITKNGKKLAAYTDDIARILKPVKRYSIGGSDITRYADDIVVVRKANGNLLIGHSPPHHIIPQFYSFTPFDQLDDATIIAFKKSADRAAINAVNQALSQDINQESLAILAEEAAKREIMKDIIISQRKTKNFVIITRAQLNQIANQSVEKALQDVQENKVSYINRS